MDNLPQGTSNYDVFRMNVVANSAVSSLLAQRIEQGIGRGTRGGGDYCVVMLIGSKLVGWIGRKSNLALLDREHARPAHDGPGGERGRHHRAAKSARRS